MNFTKYHAAGNDFILINNLDQWIKEELTPRRIALLCHRQLGIGADGLVVLQNWDDAKNILKIDLYNSDGGVTSMCANGTRCAFALLKKLNNWGDKSITIQTLSGAYDASVQGKDTWLSMPTSQIKTASFDIKKVPTSFEFSNFYFADSGVPHSLFFVPDVKQLDLVKIAPAIRHHKIFPEGCNVNFMTKVNDREFNLRTFERGVEAETLSCGTAILAISYILSRHFKVMGQVVFNTAGGILKSTLSAETISYGGYVTAVYNANLDIDFFYATR